MVPLILDTSTPFSSATATYIANKIDAGALIVIEVDTEEISIPSNNALISSMLSIATPTFPTSPKDIESSESRPS